MNLGKIIGNKYQKFVNFNKAVLWKTREISINPKMAKRFDEIEFVEFVDRSKAEVWIAPVEKVRSNWVYKKEGQEYQYYIPIEVFRKLKGTDYVSYMSGIKRMRFDRKLYEQKEIARGEYKLKQIRLL